MFYKAISKTQLERAQSIYPIFKGLDPDNNPEDQKIYKREQRNIIRFMEDQSHPNGTPYVYDDKAARGKDGKPKPWKEGDELFGNRTVAGGFNMDDDDAKDAWDKAFAKHPNKKPSFEKVINGEIRMTQEDMDILDDYSIDIRQDKLRSEVVFGERIWLHLKPHQRVAIVLANYNCRVKTYTDPKTGKKSSQSTVVGRGTNFYAHIERYVDELEKGRQKMADLQMEMARWELQFDSNKNGGDGGQSRRNAEGFLLLPEIEAKKERNIKVLEQESRAIDPNYISPRKGSGKIAQDTSSDMGDVKDPAFDDSVQTVKRSAFAALEQSKRSFEGEDGFTQALRSWANDHARSLEFHLKRNLGISHLYWDKKAVGDMIVRAYDRYSHRLESLYGEKILAMESALA